MNLSYYKVDNKYFYVHGWHNIRIRKMPICGGTLAVEHFNGMSWIVRGVFNSLDKAKSKVENDIRKECLFL